MRLDLTPEPPHELPRKRQQEIMAPPLEPSPIEQRRVQLKELEPSRRMPDIPRREYQRTAKPQPPSSLNRDRERDKELERRPKRDRQPVTTLEISLRPEEEKMLEEIGRFRVLATRDIAETIYGYHYFRLKRDLRFLEKKQILSVDTVNARRDGRGGKVQRIEVVTLTRKGRKLVRQTSGLSTDQQLYDGLVKPREVEHDTQIYRAYRKEATLIEKNGGSNLRVRLDFELKAKVQQAIYQERHLHPEQDINEAKQKIAQKFDLTVVNNTIQIPDARIDYDLDQGTRTGHQDIEVLTAAYRPGHLRGKMQAGFHLYASTSDRATLTAKIEYDHHLMENILEL